MSSNNDENITLASDLQSSLIHNDNPTANSDYGSIETTNINVAPKIQTPITSTTVYSPDETTSESIIAPKPPKPAMRQRQRHNSSVANNNQPKSAPSNDHDDDDQVVVNDEKPNHHKIVIDETLRSKFDAVQQELVQFNRNNKNNDYNHNKTKLRPVKDNQAAKVAGSAFLEQNMIATCEPQSKLEKGNNLLHLAANDNTEEQISFSSHLKRGAALHNTHIKEDEEDDNNNQTTSNCCRETAKQTRPYPKKVFFIVVNEFCERFSYYGLRTVLVLYLRSVLGFSDSNSTVSFHLFASLCYLTPVLGGILGDSVLGKFKTILYLSLVYLFGEITLVLSSIFWNNGALSVFLTFFGLFMIGLGTGGIKPCVVALGGDQFLPHETNWRQSFFSIFYASINLGSLLSMFLTPMLRSDFQCVNRADCFPYAFGVPCFLMFIAIVVFLMAKNQYHLTPLPERNEIVAFIQCVSLALRRRFTSTKHSTNNTVTNLKQINKKNLVSTQGNLTKQPTESVNSSNSSLTSSNHDNESITLNGVTKLTDFNLSKQSHQPPTPSSNSSSDISIQPTISRDFVTLSNLSNSEGALLESSSRDYIESDRRLGKAKNNQARSHWLYLASDRFDTHSIEDFRSVLSVLLLFTPLPVYWCLYDQQGSLWTLQATRMDGSLLNTGFVLEPDQISVANPLILLSLIPVFQLIIYPACNRYNLVRKPLQRMTVGGFIAALTFVVSALIEMRIQEFTPVAELTSGQAHLLLVNGLTDCNITNPTISTTSGLNISNNNSAIQLDSTLNNNNNTTISGLKLSGLNETSSAAYELKAKSFGSLDTRSIYLDLAPPQTMISGDNSPPSAAEAANYYLKFTLSSNNNNNNNHLKNAPQNGCPFDPKMVHTFDLGQIQDKSVRLYYIEQGNGKLTFKVFDDSLMLPAPGKARVRLLYESFGSLMTAEKRSFYLLNYPSDDNKVQNLQNFTSTKTTQIQFSPKIQNGQVFLSSYIDVDVPSKGGSYFIHSNDNLIGSDKNASVSQTKINLQPSTRNLIVLHQKDATNIIVKHEVLQDNSYRISMFYQLIPYFMISFSEVMFSITATEFAYSVAPDRMKSLFLALMSLTTAFGNFLTVFIESIHFFSDVAHDFLFYAALMAADMILFAILSYYYVPYRSYSNSSSKQTVANKCKKNSNKKEIMT